jgi:hypothetical protein
MIITREHIMLTGLALVCLSLVWGLHRRSISRSSHISLDDLLIGDDGKISKAAAVMNGSFLVTSWVIVFQTMNKTLTDITFSAYVAAWVIPSVTKLIKGPTPPVASSETTITQKVVTTPDAPS